MYTKTKRIKLKSGKFFLLKCTYIYQKAFMNVHPVDDVDNFIHSNQKPKHDQSTYLLRNLVVHLYHQLSATYHNILSSEHDKYSTFQTPNSSKSIKPFRLQPGVKENGIQIRHKVQKVSRFRGKSHRM